METHFAMGAFITDISPLTLLLILFGVLIVLIGVLIVVQMRNSAHIHHLTYPVYEYTVKQAEQRANQIVAEAAEKARSIRTAAEVETSKALGDREHEGERLLDLYEKQLLALTQKHEEGLSRYATSAEQSLKSLNEAFRQQTESATEIIRKELGGFVTETKAVRSHVEEEIKRLVAEQITQEVAGVR